MSVIVLREEDINMKKMVIISLLSIGLSLPAMTLGSEIEPGFDLLKTMAGTTIELPVVGPIPLEGNPALFPSGKGLMNADTIIKRKQGIDPFEPPDGEGIVDIELVALSMKSIDSFDGTPLGLPGMVDLYVTVNQASELPIPFPDLPQPCTLQPSIGSMTIQHTTADGGTFTSHLTVDSCLIFVEAGGDVNDPSHILAFIPLSDIDPDRRLEANGVWSHTPPPGLSPAPNFPKGEFVIGVSSGKRVPFIKRGTGKAHSVTLLATDVKLKAKPKRNSHQVDLTLTTSAELNTAKFIIYRGEKLPNGGTAMTKVCSFNSGNLPYNCTDKVVGDHYRVVEMEYDGDLILYDKVKP
jgi:hypothetical protein